MEATDNEMIQAVLLTHLLMNRIVSSHQLHPPLRVQLIQPVQCEIVHTGQLAIDCVDDEIAKGEDVQLGGVAGVFPLTLCRHVDNVTRVH